MALFRRRGSPQGGSGNWLTSLLGGRAIENRVDENFPTWDEYSEQKVLDAQEREEAAKRIELPPHRVYVSSPLHGNFLYFFMIVIGLALGLYSPALAPVLLYAAIAIAMLIALFVVFRDALFFHIEGLRLAADSDMINKHSSGPQDERDEKGLSFLRALSRKKAARKIFRSRLLQIHYQNVLRTFEQGNRRTWVDQDASIADLHTLLSQRGMKAAWTVIEMLPQLGLLGTLVGLMRMFVAFRGNTASPELEVLAGFATALGTTVVANFFVLVLRPLYMRNERSMHEILSTIQTLMAMFILPTQQSVLERTLALGFGRSPLPTPAVMPGAGFTGQNEGRLFRTLDELSQSLSQFAEVQQHIDSGNMARETADIAQEVKDTLRAFQESVDRHQIERQQKAMEELSDAVRGLAGRLERMEGAPAAGGNGVTSPRIEEDLTQLRVLTHDTLLLLEQIAGRLEPIPARKGRMLSTDRTVRTQLFSRRSEARAPSVQVAESGLTSLDDEPARSEEGDGEGANIRLFTERG